MKSGDLKQLSFYLLLCECRGGEAVDFAGSFATELDRISTLQPNCHFRITDRDFSN